MSDWAARVAELFERDRELNAFGARTHQYRLRPKVAELPDIVLPEDYREFITTVGNGGAGPGYGMLPFNFLAGEYLVGGTWNPNLNNPFERLAIEGMAGYDSEIWIAGTVALADFGCGFTWYLVVAGEERMVGTVCADQRAVLRGTRPYFSSFSEWYGFWLENALDPTQTQCPLGRESCALYRTIDTYIDQFKPQSLDDERAAFDQIPDGGIASTARSSDRNFNAGEKVRLCHCCRYFVDWLVDRGVLSQAKIAAGLPHKLER